MAKEKGFKLGVNIFVDEFEKEIERATKRNCDRLNTEKIIKKSHEKIVSMLKEFDQNDNKYLDLNNYKELIEISKKEKAEKKKLKELKEKEEKKKD